MEETGTSGAGWPEEAAVGRLVGFGTDQSSSQGFALTLVPAALFSRINVPLKTPTSSITTSTRDGLKYGAACRCLTIAEYTNQISLDNPI